MVDAITSAPSSPPARRGRAPGPPVFLLALLIGASLHLVILLLFHFTIVPAAARNQHAPLPAIHFNPDSPALRSLLAQVQYSPEQTYLSADKKFSTRALPRTTAPSHPVFDSFKVEPKSSEVDFRQPNQTAQMATEPGAALKPTEWDLLGAFGQAPIPGPKLAARGAFVRITQLGSLGQPSTHAVEFIWPQEFAPPASHGHWQPVSFLLRFNATGLEGAPMLKPGLDALSQSNTPNDADVNKFLLEKLRAWYTQHPPLPPGLYDAVVGP